MVGSKGGGTAKCINGPLDPERDHAVGPSTQGGTSASRGKSGDRGISQTRAYNRVTFAPTYVTRYKVIYCPTSFVGQYIQLPDFPRFADENDRPPRQ